MGLDDGVSAAPLMPCAMLPLGIAEGLDAGRKLAGVVRIFFSLKQPEDLGVSILLIPP